MSIVFTSRYSDSTSRSIEAEPCSIATSVWAGAGAGVKVMYILVCFCFFVCAIFRFCMHCLTFNLSVFLFVCVRQFMSVFVNL